MVPKAANVARRAAAARMLRNSNAKSKSVNAHVARSPACTSTAAFSSCSWPSASTPRGSLSSSSTASSSSSSRPRLFSRSDAARSHPSAGTREFSSSANKQRAVPATSPSGPSFAQSIPPAHGTSSAQAEADHAALRALFDAPQSPASNHHEAFGSSTLAPTGLFALPSLRTPNDLLTLAERTLVRARFLVARIVAAPTHSDPALREKEMSRVVRNLDRLSDVLCGVIDMCELVRNAHPEPYWSEAANAAYEYLCGYMNVLNTHTGLYQVLSEVLSTPRYESQLNREARQVALVFMRDFERSGIHLPEAERTRFVQLSDEILVLGRQFLQEVSSGEGREEVELPVDWLEGMAPAFAGALRGGVDSSASPSADGQKLRLFPNSWELQTVSKFAPDERARKLAYLVANSGSRGQIETLERLLQARAELANLVGHKSYAEMTLDDKMARTPENVEQFLRALGQHHRPLAERDLNSLRAVKQAHLGTSSPPEFNAWDRDFYAEKYLSASNLRSLSPISTFFSVGTVFAGLSRLFDSLYGIRLRARPVRAGEVWSDDVARMDVIDERDGTIGTIYADLYTRPGKPPSAAHYTVRCSRRVDNDDVRADFVLGGAGADEIPGQDTDVRPLEVDPMTLPGREGAYQLPVVVLLCDFVRPTVKEGPSLLSWHEVETLFHEMGHAIHSMIGRTEYHNVAGTRCATDFVELPSILMEHFVSCPSVVNLVARHHRTNAALPFSHLQTHLRASRALDSLDTHTQITLAALDQLYHSARAGEKGFDSTRELEALQNRLGVMRGVDGASWQGQFGHLFGYGATYYSYLFDRAIASRVWSRLFAKEPLSREAGERFKTQVLAHGGARDPWEMIASVLEDETVARGDERAMLAVGQWGIADVGVEAQK